MCSFFYQTMENDRGDLADIVRASSGGGSTNNPVVDWQFPLESVNFRSGIEEPIDDFGDPFFNMRDPLLHEELSGLAFPDGLNSTNLVKMDTKDGNSVSGNLHAQKKILGEDIQRPCNIFSRVLQISPNAKISMISPQNSSSSSASPRGIKSPLAANDLVKLNNSPGCSVENGGVQISSPRTPGMKRRKSQAKKVVCIPAPAAASSSRTSGEVVPSDLWAWRKYGQKPIKGSPYPRGYYRCSSSKGCSARKQVERSRADPNMLVITYTSEHNHPWPTQRNALAGSTRSQPAKNNATSKSSPSSSQRPTNLKEEQEEKENESVSPGILEGPMTNVSIKEEMGEIEKNIDIDDREFDRGFNQSYRPALPNSNQTDDFFADLGELEPDPLNIIFSHGFSGEKSGQERDNKALDPFNLFDWSGNTFGDNTRRGL